MSEIEWIKLDVDMFDNRKIKHIRKLPEGNNIVLIWVMLLTLAGRCNAGGLIFLTENIPYSTKMLADELDFEENTVKLAIEALERFGMISTDGFLSITGWEEHQNATALDSIREYNRIAKQKSRERQKQKQLAACVNDMSMTSQSDFNEKSDFPSYSLYSPGSNSISPEKEIGVQGEEEKQQPAVEAKEDKKPADLFEEFAAGDKDLLDTLRDFEKMRNKTKKPLTERAKVILLNKLRDKIPKEQWIPALEKSILKTWDSVYPLDGDQRGSTGGNGKNGFGENKRSGYGGSYQQNTEHNTDFSRIRPSLDPDDYPDSCRVGT